MQGFSVMTTKTKMGSLHKVSQIARDVLWKARNGSIDCNYTYDEFITAVNLLDEDKGNPPTEREHQNPAPPIVESLTPLGRHSALLQTNTSTGDNGATEMSEEQKEKEKELNKNSIAQLKKMCKERDEKTSGSKKDLIGRLLQKRKPEILITRVRHKQYVPKLPSCNAAILVAIFLHDETGKTMMQKQTIMNLAEETGISKDPMFGNGKSWYDGELQYFFLISSLSFNFCLYAEVISILFNQDGLELRYVIFFTHYVFMDHQYSEEFCEIFFYMYKKDLTGGDPPLISVVKRKYALTTQPHGAAGVDVARALHVMAHRMNLCRCGKHVPT